MTQPDSADLYRIFRDPLISFISKRVSNLETVEDLVHDVFVRIHTHIGTIKEPEKISAWIYQIARNTIIDFYRKKREPAMEIEEDLLPAAHELIPDASKRLAPALREMIERLPDKYREALWLADFDGKKHSEISKQLGISVSGVKSRVQRAHRMLKELLLECCHFEFDRYGTVFEYSPRKCELCCTKSKCETSC